MRLDLQDTSRITMPAGVYVTNSMDIEEPFDSRIAQAFNTISSVHGIMANPPPPRVKVVIGNLHGDNSGQSGYCCDATACEIAMQPDAPHFEYTLIHEVGHYIDQYCIKDIQWSSQHGNLQVMEFIRQSGRYQQLKKAHRNLIQNYESIDAPGYQKRGFKEAIESLLSEHEMFAYAYVQYITMKSRETYLLQQFDEVRAKKEERQLPRTWDKDDFRKILNEMDGLFWKLGWLY